MPSANKITLLRGMDEDDSDLMWAAYLGKNVTNSFAQ